MSAVFAFPNPKVFAKILAKKWRSWRKRRKAWGADLAWKEINRSRQSQNMRWPHQNLLSTLLTAPLCHWEPFRCHKHTCLLVPMQPKTQPSHFTSNRTLKPQNIEDSQEPTPPHLQTSQEHPYDSSIASWNTVGDSKLLQNGVSRNGCVMGNVETTKHLLKTRQMHPGAYMELTPRRKCSQLTPLEHVPVRLKFPTCSSHHVFYPKKTSLDPFSKPISVKSAPLTVGV